jgi:hypothetical protein
LDCTHKDSHLKPYSDWKDGRALLDFDVARITPMGSSLGKNEPADIDAHLLYHLGKDAGTRHRPPIKHLSDYPQSVQEADAPRRSSRRRSGGRSDLPAINGGATLDASNAPSAVTISGAPQVVTFLNSSPSQDWTVSAKPRGRKFGAGGYVGYDVDADGAEIFFDFDGQNGMRLGYSGEFRRHYNAHALSAGLQAKF